MDYIVDKALFIIPRIWLVYGGLAVIKADAMI